MLIVMAWDHIAAEEVPREDVEGGIGVEGSEERTRQSVYSELENETINGFN
jgi:hypothetical protein